MKCVIAGGRTIGLKEVDGKMVQMTLEDAPFIMDAFTRCDWYDKITEIVSGRARGIDNLGEQLAMKLNLNMCTFPADWKDISRKGVVIRTNKYGKYNTLAGHMRNEDMAKYTDIAIVIMALGGSSGSLNMIDNMKKINKPCFVYELVNSCLVRKK